jgi:hypothetical protein
MLSRGSHTSCNKLILPKIILKIQTHRCFRGWVATDGPSLRPSGVLYTLRCPMDGNSTLDFSRHQLGVREDSSPRSWRGDQRSDPIEGLSLRGRSGLEGVSLSHSQRPPPLLRSARGDGPSPCSFTPQTPPKSCANGLSQFFLLFH